MANKVECDRCKTQASPSAQTDIPGGWQRIMVGDSYSTRDLCHACIKLFWRWLQEKS